METAQVAKVLSWILRSLFAIVLFSGAAQPAAAYVGFWERFVDYDHTWAGAGSITLDATGCIVSSTARNESVVADGGGSARDYLLRVSPPSASFALHSGSYALPVGLQVTDLFAGGTQALIPNQYSSDLVYWHYCATRGHNARLSLLINEADLYSVPAGTYTADFGLRAERVGNGGGSSSATDILGATVVVPELIQITNIDDISFGVYDGVSSTIARNESFCIYSNAAEYRVTPSSATTGSSPASFAMADSSGNDIEYSVKVNNSPDASSGVSLTNGEVSGPFSADLSPPLSLNCNGGDNAAVSLEVLGSELQTKPAGSYSGTLTLQVAPI